MNFFEHQDQARKTSTKLVLLFLLAVVLIAIAVSMCFFAVAHWGFEATDTPYLDQAVINWFRSGAFFIFFLIAIGLISLGSLIRWIRLRKGGQSVAEWAGATPVDYNSKDLKVQQYINTAEEMAIASGTPVPELYILEQESSINAFVAGYQPDQAVMVVTQGLLEHLDRDQLQGVLGHEYSHVLNGDMRINVRLMSVLAGLVLLGQLGRFLFHSSSSSYRVSSREKKGNGLALVGLALMIIGAIGVFFARWIKAAISRQREYLADASAVQFTRNPEGIAGALYQIKRHSDGSLLNSKRAEEMSHMCFGRSLEFSSFSKMMATHPPLSDRIQRVSPGFVSVQLNKENKDLQRQAAETSDAEFSTTMGSTSAMMGMAASAVASVGQPSINHVEYAKKIHQELPEHVKHLLHTSAGARAFCYIVIIKTSGVAAQNIVNQIKKEDQDAAKVLLNLWSWQKTMPSRYRLPMLDMAIPVLKRLTDEDKTEFLNRIDSLIKADEQLHFREWILRCLLRLHLSKSDAKPNHTSIKQLQKVNFELQTLLSAMVYHSSDRKTAEAAYKMAMTNLGLKDTWLLNPSAMDLNETGKVLNHLRQLNYLLRQPVLQACADILISDEQVNVDEYEYLRLIADVLGCPMPPMIEREQIYN